MAPTSGQTPTRHPEPTKHESSHMSPTKTKTHKSSSRKAAAAEASPSIRTTQYAVGDEIAHPKFGEGTVSDTEADKLTIKFTDGRVKQILDSYVKRRRS